MLTDLFFFFKQKTAYEVRISDWSSDVCSSDLTSTIKSGAPDDIKITSAGSIKPTVAGPAVTIDSNHKVVNEGTIEFTNVDGATGIVAGAGTSGGITNGATGKITIGETYAATDIDKDGDQIGRETCRERVGQ